MLVVEVLSRIDNWFASKFLSYQFEQLFEACMES